MSGQDSAVFIRLQDEKCTSPRLSMGGLKKLGKEVGSGRGQDSAVSLDLRDALGMVMTVGQSTVLIQSEIISTCI